MSLEVREQALFVERVHGPKPAVPVGEVKGEMVLGEPAHRVHRQDCGVEPPRERQLNRLA